VKKEKTVVLRLECNLQKFVSKK